MRRQERGVDCGSKGKSVKEAEEDRIPEGDQGGGVYLLTASPWGTKGSGTGGLQLGVLAGWSDDWKAPYKATDKAGTRSCHGAREGQGGNYRGRRENVRAEPSGVRKNKGGRKASGVDPESHGVREREGGARPPE